MCSTVMPLDKNWFSEIHYRNQLKGLKWLSQIDKDKINNNWVKRRRKQYRDKKHVLFTRAPIS